MSFDIFTGCLFYLLKHCLIMFLLYAVFKVQLTVTTVNGDKGIRTLDPLLARQVLSQLSYTPINRLKQAFYLSKIMASSSLVGLSGLEPPTSRLSGVRSNRLSYKPIFSICKPLTRYFLSKRHPPALPYRLQ